MPCAIVRKSCKSVRAGNASEETRSPSTTAAPRNVSLCSTTGLSCSPAVIGARKRGKNLKLSETGLLWSMN